MTRVLIVDDSRVALMYLSRILESDPDIKVIGTAFDGEEAVRFALSHRPDVILMDIHMPVTDGYEATRRIMETSPVPIVIVTGSMEAKNVAKTFRALEAGAVALLGKPRDLSCPDGKADASKILETVKLMSEVRVVRRIPKRETVRASSGVLRASRGDAAGGLEVVAIGASTGGPPAVRTILAGLPANLRSSVLIVQHITQGFLPGLIRWLEESSALPVRIPNDGDRMEPGHVYLAPDNVHMGVATGGYIRLSVAEPEHGARPAVSHLFRSVAQAYGGRAAAALLTGMGRDGADELLTIRRAGGVTFAQDETSSVVYGMPGEAVKLGAACHVLPPVEIARALTVLATAGDKI